jgi:hypothetical protein
MPATATEFAQTAQDQTVKTVKQGQQAVVEAVRTWANAVEKAMPETVPYADKLPKPKAIAEAVFDFAEALLKAEREFVESLLDAAAPVIEPKTPAKKKPSQGTESA